MGQEIDVYFKQFLNGDHEAFRIVYKLYYPLMYNYGSQFGVEKEIIDDSIQDVFIDIWKYGKKLRIQSPKSYLMRCLRNKIISSIKKNSDQKAKNIQYHNEEFQIEYDPSLITEIAEDRSMLEWRLRSALEELSPKQREIIFLVYFNNLSFKEAADIMGIKIKTAYNQIHKAILKLRSTLTHCISIVAAAVCALLCA